MKIEIENDVFDVVKRIKEIDDGYYVMFDTKRCKYELHNKYQKNTYCLTYPYSDLDNRLIDIIMYTSMSNMDNIINDIDKNNDDIEKYSKLELKSQTDYMLREIYDFASNSSKEFEKTSFATKWR